MKNRKIILVTGANGLIGYNLINKLIEHHFVYAVTRSELKINNKNYREIKYDFYKNNKYDFFPKSVDIIYHLAQSENFRNFPEKAFEIYKVNTQSTLSLLEYGRKAGCEKFIYASSGGIYGNSNHGFNENTPLKQNKNIGFYLTSKFCSELLLDNYNQFFNVIISRFFFVYGERQNKTMLIPRLLDNIKKGREINLNGEEGIKINPIYVDDAVNALIEMLKLSKSNKVNIAGSEIISIKDICEIISSLLKIKPNYKKVDLKPLHLIGDISKMKLLLGSPKVKFHEGIYRLIKNDI